jgi:hypothetical protein
MTPIFIIFIVSGACALHVDQAILDKYGIKEEVIIKKLCTQLFS